MATATDQDDALFALYGLRVEIAGDGGPVCPVDGVSWDIRAGETIAVVGESGSGKSMTALAALGLLPEGARVTAGEAWFAGEPLPLHDRQAMRRLRGKRIAMVFQEPMTSLNPVRSIGSQLTEGMRLHLGLDRRKATARAIELLNLVGIAEPERRLTQYPHHLSGGMRQRVMIAMALACEPELIIADEPTTALDVTIQAQILTLMQDLSARLGVALVLITHNLGVVARYARRVNVMYAGRIVEHGTAEAVYGRPRHPYTLGLLQSVPRPDKPRGEPLRPIPGNPPQLQALPAGCAFHPRCALAGPRCREETPELTGADWHWSACWHRDRVGELDDRTAHPALARHVGAA